MHVANIARSSLLISSKSGPFSVIVLLLGALVLSSTLA